MKPGVFLYTIGLGWPERFEFFHQQAVAEGGKPRIENCFRERVCSIAAGSMNQGMKSTLGYHMSSFFADKRRDITGVTYIPLSTLARLMNSAGKTLNIKDKNLNSSGF